MIARLIRRLRIRRRRRHIAVIVRRQRAEDLVAFHGVQFLRMLERSIYGDVIAYPEIEERKVSI